MLGTLPPFDYYRPSSLEEALAVLKRLDGNVCPYAGGTDLLVALKHKRANDQALLDLKGIPELGRVRSQDGGLSIGGTVTTRALARSAMVRERFALLPQALKILGSMQIGNRATLGGNLCNASPAADGAPPLLVLGASVKLVGLHGERRLPLEKFFLGPKKSALNHELLTEVHVPRAPAEGRGAFFKLGPRGAPEDIAIVSVAVFAVSDAAREKWREVRIALGAVAPMPTRARNAEEALLGQPINRRAIHDASRLAAEKDAQPISDIRASAGYRRAMVQVLVGRMLEHMAGEISREGVG